MIDLLIFWACRAANATHFIGPNELHPIYLKVVVQERTPGALISVGADRALFAAILLPHVTSVVQVDHDAEVVRYNSINLALLRAARSRADYLHLRFRATAAEWKARSIAGTHAWWHEVIDELDFFDFQYPALHPPDRIVHPSGLVPFEGANYLVEDAAFARVQGLARAGKIEVRQGDLTDRASMRALLTSQGPISLVDVSNAWWNTFAGVNAIVDLSAELQEIQPAAHVIYTDRIYTVGVGVDWIYRAVPAGDAGLATALETLEKDPDRWLNPMFKRDCAGRLRVVLPSSAR